MSQSEILETLSRNLRRYLNEYDMTQAELARKLDVSAQTITNWVNGQGEPRMSKIDKMCEIFHCKRSDLLEEKTETEDTPHYIIDPDAEKMIVDMYENPDLRVVFDCARKVKPEDLEQVAKLIKTFIPEDDNDHIC